MTRRTIDSWLMDIVERLPYRASRVVDSIADPVEELG